MGARKEALRALVDSEVGGEPDPTANRDLSAVPTQDLKGWLEAERNVVRDYMLRKVGNEQEVKRARWASSRVKRIEAELRQRSSRHRPMA